MFLLNASPDVLADWYNSVPDDDKEYAAELMIEYSAELELKKSLISNVDVTNLELAKSYLKNYTLGSSE